MAKDLITIQEYKSYAGINSNGQDSEISSIIPKVSALVKTICRRTFVDWVDESKTEIFTGGLVLLPQETPVIRVLDLEYSDNYGASYTSLVEYTDWVFDSENQQIICVGPKGEFERKTNGYRLTYTCGYEELPVDLKLAVLDLVTYYLKHEGSVQSQITVSSTNPQIQYLSGTNLPGHIKRVLDLYVQNYN